MGFPSFPFTNSYFSRWLLHHQPDRYESVSYLVVMKYTPKLQRTIKERSGHLTSNVRLRKSWTQAGREGWFLTWLWEITFLTCPVWISFHWWCLGGMRAGFVEGISFSLTYYLLELLKRLFFEVRSDCAKKSLQAQGKLQEVDSLAFCQELALHGSAPWLWPSRVSRDPPWWSVEFVLKHVTCISMSHEQGTDMCKNWGDSSFF